MEAAELQQQQSADLDKKTRKKRSRWGAETEAGLKVLAGDDVPHVQQPAEGQQPGEVQQQAQQSAPADDGAGAEGGRKKRRSRWEPETEAKPALFQGLQIALPPAIAALVDIHVDPRVMELQRQLNTVSAAAGNVVGLCWEGTPQASSSVQHQLLQPHAGRVRQPRPAAVALVLVGLGSWAAHGTSMRASAAAADCIK
jgi:hypothetical protein